jgi:hypothetical protein
MRAGVQVAAKALLDDIHAPAGAVNTIIGTDNRGPHIRVMIDPFYWLVVSNVPETFQGFRVVVEKREPAFAQAR